MAQSQKPKSIAVVIVVLCLVVLAIGGIVTWFFYNTHQNAGGSTQQNSQQADPNSGYIVVKEWGVRFKPVDGLMGVTYTVGTQAASRYQTTAFSTQAITSQASECSANPNGHPALGYLYRSANQADLSSPDAILREVVKIGNYYYAYVTPQAACGDNNTAADELQTQTLALFKTSIATLEAAR